MNQVETDIKLEVEDKNKEEETTWDEVRSESERERACICDLGIV